MWAKTKTVRSVKIRKIQSVQSVVGHFFVAKKIVAHSSWFRSRTSRRDDVYTVPTETIEKYSVSIQHFTSGQFFSFFHEGREIFIRLSLSQIVANDCSYWCFVRCFLIIIQIFALQKSSTNYFALVLRTAKNSLNIRFADSKLIAENAKSGPNVRTWSGRCLSECTLICSARSLPSNKKQQHSNEKYSKSSRLNQPYDGHVSLEEAELRIRGKANCCSERNQLGFEKLLG